MDQEKKPDHNLLLFSSAFYLSGRAVDTLATRIGLYNHLGEEMNLAAKLVMDQLGVDNGLIVLNLLTTIPLLYFSTLLNEETRSNLGSYSLLLAGAVGYTGGILWESFHHVSDYLF